ncbi:hypothetical protein ACLKA7_002506 [Drosophila subpalustris]
MVVILNGEKPSALILPATQFVLIEELDSIRRECFNGWHVNAVVAWGFGCLESANFADCGDGKGHLAGHFKEIGCLISLLLCTSCKGGESFVQMFCKDFSSLAVGAAPNTICVPETQNF